MFIKFIPPVNPQKIEQLYSELNKKALEQQLQTKLKECSVKDLYQLFFHPNSNNWDPLIIEAIAYQLIDRAFKNRFDSHKNPNPYTTAPLLRLGSYQLKRSNNKHLNLNNHALGKKLDIDFFEMFWAIPDWVNKLSLRGNYLNKKTAAQLTRACDCLNEKDSDLLSLDLSNNGLGSFSEEELINILNSKPKKLRELNLKENGLNQAQICSLFDSLRDSTLGCLILDEGILDSDTDRKLKVILQNNRATHARPHGEREEIDEPCNFSF